MIPNIKYDDTQYDSYNIFHKLKTENSNYPPDPSCRNLLPPKYVRIPIDIKNDLFPYYMISPDLGINSYFHELGTNENILSYPNKSKISHLVNYFNNSVNVS